MSLPTGLPRGTWLDLRLRLRATRFCGLAVAWPRAVRAVLALYVLAAAMMPLAHHDVVCHLKSSTHCTTCVVGSSAETTADCSSLPQHDLKDLGTVPGIGSHVAPAALPGDVSGRAPPSFA